ncbi:MAG: serine--tRNA ligase [Bacteroidales bacterium]
MLTLPYIRENREIAIQQLRVRNFDAAQTIDKLLEADLIRRENQSKVNELQAEMNQISKEIGQLFKNGENEKGNQARQRTAEIKNSINELSAGMHKATGQINDLLVLIPNIPNELVPPGSSEVDNQTIREGGEMPVLAGDTKPHWEIAKEYDLIDFDLGVKLTGAGFPVYKGAGARFQRALISFFLDRNIDAGYTEILPPLMVNADSGFGTGQLPDKEGQMYHVQSDEFYLIPTAEVPVTNIYRDVILEETQLPIKNTAYTPCFRREAGSYGKDVRGLNRVHQFDKVEIVQIQSPENSYTALEEMVSHVESLINDLQLPYRIVRLCGGDLGFTSAMTYDFEVYAAAQDKWLEVSSVSNFESFQANRLKLRYKKRGEKKPVLAHTLNGSALALPRIVAALLENNQTKEGIVVPKILRNLMGTDKIIQ